MTLAHTSRIFLFRELRVAALLSIPFWIFVLSLLVLFLQHGGHRFAYLSTNPYCRLPASRNASHGTNPLPVTVLLQISDLHVNDIDDGRAKFNLRLFQTKALPRWAPVASAVLVSGDLVNSVSQNRYPFGATSVQHASEWQWLNEFVADVNKSVPWIAAHGNHDTFGGSVHTNPHSSTCEPQEAAHKTTLRGAGGGALSVFAMDCTLPKPLHRPLNFFGDGRRAVAQLMQSLVDPESNGEDEMAVAFGHYPTAVMAGGRGVHAAAMRGDGEAVLQKPRVAAFLSGHLHTLKGLAPAGLQAVSKAGVLELQLPDMIGSGAFRVLVLDGGSLSFKDFSVRDDRGVGLDDVVVTNLPKAGFCSAGAGAEALKSTHVRFIGPKEFLTGLEIEVRIDGVLLGTVARLSSECGKKEQELSHRERPAKCVPVYGVPWDASLYDDDNLHKLSLHSGAEQSRPYVFSFDGAPEPGMKSRLRRLISALFSLSDFETMATRLCSLGFFFCFAFCVPGLLQRQATTCAVFFMAILLRFGPAFIITRQLTDTDTGIGIAGLQYVRLPTAVHRAGVDLPYMMSLQLYGSLIPASFFNAVTLSYMSYDLRHANVTLVFALLYLMKSLSWCLEIFGAHGFLAGLISPSCTPLLVSVMLSTLVSFLKLRKRARNE